MSVQDSERSLPHAYTLVGFTLSFLVSVQCRACFAHNCGCGLYANLKCLERYTKQPHSTSCKRGREYRAANTNTRGVNTFCRSEWKKPNSGVVFAIACVHLQFLFVLLINHQPNSMFQKQE